MEWDELKTKITAKYLGLHEVVLRVPGTPVSHFGRFHWIGLNFGSSFFNFEPVVTDTFSNVIGRETPKVSSRDSRQQASCETTGSHPLDSVTRKYPERDDVGQEAMQWPRNFEIPKRKSQNWLWGFVFSCRRVFASSSSSIPVLFLIVLIRFRVLISQPKWSPSEHLNRVMSNFRHGNHILKCGYTQNETQLNQLIPLRFGCFFS